MPACSKAKVWAVGMDNTTHSVGANCQELHNHHSTIDGHHSFDAIVSISYIYALRKLVLLPSTC